MDFCGDVRGGHVLWLEGAVDSKKIRVLLTLLAS